MTKVQVNNNIFYFELNSKLNVDIIGITVSTWKRHNLKTIFMGLGIKKDHTLW